MGFHISIFHAKSSHPDLITVWLGNVCLLLDKSIPHLIGGVLLDTGIHNDHVLLVVPVRSHHNHNHHKHKNTATKTATNTTMNTNTNTNINTDTTTATTQKPETRGRQISCFEKEMKHSKLPRNEWHVLAQPHQRHKQRYHTTELQSVMRAMMSAMTCTKHETTTEKGNNGLVFTQVSEAPRGFQK